MSEEAERNPRARNPKREAERLQAEAFAVLRTAQKMYEMAARDGYLHPATFREMQAAFAALDVQVDRVWLMRTTP